jgi:hypothetical protein
MPTHIASQALPGSPEAAFVQLCKARLADVGKRHGAPVIDFRIRSSITSRDSNFWDVLHYRLPIAHRIVDDIARAVTTRLDDPAGDWIFIDRNSNDMRCRSVEMRASKLCPSLRIVGGGG